MEIAIEYEKKKYLEFSGESTTFILGANHDVKWKLYRGLKRFATGKNLSELEENVYGDDGIVIKCDDKKVKAKDLPLYFLDCRESFLEQYRYTKGNMMQKYVDSLEKEFLIARQFEVINDEVIKLEIELQNFFKQTFSHVSPIINMLTYKDVIKNSFELSFEENKTPFPIEMMDISMLIDDYCTLLIEEIERTQRKIWLWINNPNSFISKTVFEIFLIKLKEIAKDTGLLHIFIMSDDYIDISYQTQDISNTILVYDSYQQLPDYEVLTNSLSNYYPDEMKFSTTDLVESLYRVFQYVGLDGNAQKIYLKGKDMVLLKVITQLLNCSTPIKCTELDKSLSEMEMKFLLS